jgi:hypothetical protein
MTMKKEHLPVEEAISNHKYKLINLIKWQKNKVVSKEKVTKAANQVQKEEDKRMKKE